MKCSLPKIEVMNVSYLRTTVFDLVNGRYSLAQGVTFFVSDDFKAFKFIGTVVNDLENNKQKSTIDTTDYFGEDYFGNREYFTGEESVYIY